MKKNRTGQSVVEFALILPILLLIIMGALDLGRAFYMKIAVINSAREGAYYLSYNPMDKTNCDLSDPKFCFLVQTSVINEAYSAGMEVLPRIFNKQLLYQWTSVKLQLTADTIDDF